MHVSPALPLGITALYDQYSGIIAICFSMFAMYWRKWGKIFSQSIFGHFRHKFSRHYGENGQNAEIQFAIFVITFFFLKNRWQNDENVDDPQIPILVNTE